MRESAQCNCWVQTHLFGTLDLWLTKVQTSVLSSWLQKLLLEAIEGSGLAREEISLLDIVNRDDGPVLFGNHGSTRRRLVQRQFSEWKIKSIQSWIELLTAHHVNPSATSLRSLQEEANE